MFRLVFGDVRLVVCGETEDTGDKDPTEHDLELFEEGGDGVPKDEVATGEVPSLSEGLRPRLGGRLGRRRGKAVRKGEQDGDDC